MRTWFSALLLAGFGAAVLFEAPPAALAAELGAATSKTLRVKTRHSLRVVRDYDGTPIVIRRGPVVLHEMDGTKRVVMNSQETVPLQRPTPHYYLNGQPVRRGRL